MVQPFGLPLPNDNDNSRIVTHQNDPFNLPPGFRFCPFDHELILYYLKPKNMNYVLPHNLIQEVNLYKYSPEQLSGRYPKLGDKDLFFFTHRDRKYKNGSRPNRAAGDGYWKATSKDKAITHEANDGVIGYKKTLVYYEGRPPKGKKTNWIMREYTVKKESTTPKPRGDNAHPMRLDDWVLCRIYKKADNVEKSTQKEDENNIVEANTSPSPCPPQDEESVEPVWAAPQLVTEVKFGNNEENDEVQGVRFSFPWLNQMLPFQEDAFEFGNHPAYNDPQFINSDSFIPENICNQPFDFDIDDFLKVVIYQKCNGLSS